MRDIASGALSATQVLMPGEQGYPRGLSIQKPSPILYTRGNSALLTHHLIGLFCSIRCPGGAILRAIDWVKTVPTTGVAVISGFHSPIEQECLALLLRRGIPVVVCPAREIACYRYPKSWEDAVLSGRLLMLSPFANKHATVVLANKRNALVAALADALVVVHAPEGSRTHAVVESAGNKPITKL